MKRLLLFALGIIAVVTFSPVAAAQTSNEIKVLAGFQIEQVYSVPKEQGSWVCLTTDPKGRLITSDQYGKLYRITPGREGTPTGVETIPVEIGFAQGLLCAFDSLYVMAHEGEGRPSGLYRVRDTNRDDVFDTVTLLRPLQGAGEHGPHAVVLAPDKKSLLICCGNHTDLTPIQSSLVPQRWQEDQLLPRIWDPGGHAVGRMAPGGWIARTDPDGKSFELISAGYRNQYDMAFDPNGELFTYDSDMEWDIGTPWYRPTMVCHATSGSEFGWRSGNFRWPEYYPDSLPSVIDIGPGSPTGIVFGTGAKFPEKYQRSLFICDWSYGNIHAVHLTPKGATFQGEAELFCSAPALQAADIIIGNDGALYFVTGGRNTSSSLYRISYRGSESTAPAAPVPPTEAALLRRHLESLQTAPRDQASEVVAQAWPHLNSDDRWIRFAARTALEHQDETNWSAKVSRETEIWPILESAMGLARTNHQPLQGVALAALSRLDWKKLSDVQRLHLIRDYALLFVRSERPQPIVVPAILQQLSDKFPCGSAMVDRELCRILAAAGSPDLVPRAMKLLSAASTQEEQIHYAAMLRVCQEGWTPELRRAYFEWFVQSGNLAGGNSFNGFIKAIRDDAIAALPDADRAALNDVLILKATPSDPYAELKARPLVKEWTVADFVKTLQDDLVDRDFDNGKTLFTIAQCFKCHRMEGQGGYVGPDLAGVGRRYSREELLESLIDPNRTISDQYQSTRFLMKDGHTITGRVVNLNGNDFLVQTDMLNPSILSPVNVDQIEERTASKVSMMPEGMLNTLTKEEILDLIAYMRSGGDRSFEELKRE